MKRISIAITLLVLLSSCSSAKKAEKSIEKGDYDKAFNIAITKLTKDKHKKSNQKLIPTLKEAYDKAYTRDVKTIRNLKKLNDPTYLKRIYTTYVAMEIRQDEVLMLQPLYFNNQEVIFKTKNYTNDIKVSLDNYSKYLFDLGTQKLKGSKFEARDAYKVFNDLDFINPSYVNNIGDLIKQAKLKGSSLVLLLLNNKIAQQTTQEHIDELLRISESNMSNPWVIYHPNKDNSTAYDFEVSISLDQLHITPEQMNTEIIQQQARVKDGWEYVYDSDGNVMKDSLGNDIKQDRIITVQAEVKMKQQAKASRIEGDIEVRDLNSNTRISVTPIFGEAKFENVFALFQGDQRAIEEKYHKALQNKEVPYPTDEDFVKYAIAEYRLKMIQFLNDQPF